MVTTVDYIQRSVKNLGQLFKAMYRQRLAWSVLVVVVALSMSNAVCDAADPAREHKALPDSYESCVAQGGRVDVAAGRRCTTETGLVFIESEQTQRPSAPRRSNCKDLCGDGTCQEVVCMAIGCPCAESSTSCPGDCKGSSGE